MEWLSQNSGLGPFDSRFCVPFRILPLKRPQVHSGKYVPKVQALHTTRNRITKFTRWHERCRLRVQLLQIKLLQTHSGMKAQEEMENCLGSSIVK